ncbi:MAG: hypothetical protein OEW19_08830, partial [Acidobacteriota bacterium]|nr:hypothetical protein [Acidobacteriota bacterium]
MTMRTLLLVAGLMMTPAVAAPQTPEVDPRWAPYLGCWQLRMQSTTDGIADLIAAAARQAPSNDRTDDVMICITPSDRPQSVAQQTVLNGETVLDEIVSTDGANRTAQEGDCASTRRAEWSSTGRQLFTRGTITCAGQPERRVSGLSMMVPGPTWVDVQMVDVNGRRSLRTRRYGMSREQIRAGGRAAASTASPALLARWSMDEVKEASRKTAPEVLQAALIEVGNKFPLNSQRLVELARAGVPGTVVDVMMALTFPEKFVIDRPTYGGGGWGVPYGGGTSVDPWAVAGQYGWLSMYAPFGYQYYGFYDPRFGPGWG